MHRIKKTAAPVPPPSALSNALKDAWKWSNKSIFGRTGLPQVEGPAAKAFLKTPMKAVKEYGAGQMGHIKRLGEPGGVSKALLDMSPLTATSFAIPELLGQGLISGAAHAPSERKGQEIGGAGGRLLGGQLMMRAGIPGMIAGGALGDIAGRTIGKGVDAARQLIPKKDPNLEEQKHLTYQPADDFTDYQVSGGGPIKHGGSFGDVEQPLPEIAGTSPQFNVGGPGMDEVKGKGRFVGRNGPYRNVDEFRDISSPEMEHIFYADNGYGSGGGQPYADKDKYTHTGVLQGLMNRLNKPVDPTVSEYDGR